MNRGCVTRDGRQEAHGKEARARSGQPGDHRSGPLAPGSRRARPGNAGRKPLRCVRQPGNGRSSGNDSRRPPARLLGKGHSPLGQASGNSAGTRNGRPDPTQAQPAIHTSPPARPAVSLFITGPARPSPPEHGSEHAHAPRHRHEAWGTHIFRMRRTQRHKGHHQGDDLEVVVYCTVHEPTSRSGGHVRARVCQFPGDTDRAQSQRQLPIDGRGLEHDPVSRRGTNSGVDGRSTCGRSVADELSTDLAMASSTPGGEPSGTWPWWQAGADHPRRATVPPPARLRGIK